MTSNKKCKQVSWDDDGGKINGVVVGECMTGSTPSTLNEEITYEDVHSYLEYIVATYTTLIDSIKTKPVNVKEITDIKDILVKFAQMQDSIYARQYRDHDAHLADDLFEVILATHNRELFENGDFGKGDAERNKIMHDAWLLGKMFIIEKDGTISQQFNDNGEALEKGEEITKANFEELKNADADEYKKKPMSIKVRDYPFTFQWKRIFTDKHILKFEKLSLEQQKLDNPPQFTYIAIITEDDKAEIEKFIKKYEISLPLRLMQQKPVEVKDGGGKRKDTMKDSGKRIILAGTSGKRILYIGDRGKKYIKKGGEYVALNKTKYTCL